DLEPRIDLLPRLSVARAEVAVVVDDGGKPRLGERLGVFVEVHLLHGGEAVSQDDCRKLTRSIWHVVPAAECRPVGCGECNVSAHISSVPGVLGGVLVCGTCSSGGRIDKATLLSKQPFPLRGNTW